jgi:hypothetical protein
MHTAVRDSKIKVGLFWGPIDRGSNKYGWAAARARRYKGSVRGRRWSSGGQAYAYYHGSMAPRVVLTLELSSATPPHAGDHAWPPCPCVSLFLAPNSSSPVRGRCYVVHRALLSDRSICSSIGW